MSAVSLKTECRTCLEKAGSVLPIFMVDEEFGVDTSFAEIIMSSCPSVQINSNDGLPDSICSDCAAKLLDFYKFKVKIEQNQLVLRSRVSDLNTDVKNCINQCEIPIKKEYLSDDSENEEPCTTNKAETENGVPEFKHKIDAFEHEIIKQEFNNDMNVDCDELVIQDELIEEGEVLENQVPKKSGNHYHSAYQKFVKWCQEKDLNDYSEATLMAYFSDLRTRLKSSTMWSEYSKIKLIINLNNGVDIGKYHKLRAFLKKIHKDYVKVSPKEFTKEEINKFLTEAPDLHYLGTKVVLIIGVSGACNCEELVRIRTDHIQDLGSLLVIKIRDKKTNRTRSFNVLGENFVNMYRKYAALRPKDMEEGRFFLKYLNGKCHRATMGINKCGSIPREVANYLKLPNWKDYTGHCLRKSSSSLL